MLRPDHEAFSTYARRIGLLDDPQRCFLYLMRCDRYTIDDAKAEAQRHYERCIRSALV